LDKLKHNDLIGLKDLSAEEILFIISTAEQFKKKEIKTSSLLKAHTVLTLFYEPSTRTQVSFATAIRTLGAKLQNISISHSSVKKGETLLDTANNLMQMGVSALVIRHMAGGAPALLAKHLPIPIINAGDGFNEHPTQALLDIMTMKEKKGSLKNKHVVIVGDIAHSRVARSNIWGLTKLGAKVTLCAPPTLIPMGIEKMGVTIEYDLDKALQKADFVNALRMQHERQDNPNFIPSKREYHHRFGLYEKRLRRAPQDLIILHPGPINRGVELSSEVADGPQNVILEQVENGIAIRMAVLSLLLDKGVNK